MTEPEQVEFRERIVATPAKADAQSLAVRAGIVAGSAALVVVGAVAAMGGSSDTSSAGALANTAIVTAPGAGVEPVAPFHLLSNALHASIGQRG